MNDDQRLIDAMEEFVPRAMRTDGTPGLNLAVARHSRLVWKGGFGLADIASQRPMTADTVVRAGSMGKLYTAVAVLQMVEQGLLSLDEPVTRYVDFPIENPLGDRPITARDLMHHRSGLTSDTGGCDHVSMPPLAEFLRASYASETLDEYEHSVRRWGAKVGERFQYSNVGLATLGYLVEVTNPDGLSCSDYIRTRILEPLGMESSDYPPLTDAESSAAAMSGCSTGYAGYGELLVATPPIMFGSYPAGSLFTTPADHLRLLLALLAGGAIDGNRVLQERSVEEMLRPVVDAGEDVHVGLVARMSKLGELDEHFHHWGAFMWGWQSGSAAFPRLDLAITVCTNLWDMVGYLDPLTPTSRTLVSEFVSGWYARLARGYPPLPTRSWEWKSSYAAGLSLAERTKGVLGIDDALPQAIVDDVVARTHSQPTWDPDGFRSGVEDMLGVRQTPDAVAAFLSSPDIRVLPAELALIHAEMGGRGPFALPAEIGSWLVTGPGDTATVST